MYTGTVVACGTVQYGEVEDYSLVINSSVANDVGSVALMNPTIIPQSLQLPWFGKVKNFGTDPQSFDVETELRENAVSSSSETNTVASLASSATSNLNGYFDLSSLGTSSTFDLSLETKLSGDQDTGNDFLSNYTRACIKDTTYAWDDGVSEGSVGYDDGSGWLGQLHYFSSEATLTSITINWGTIPGTLAGNSFEIFNVSGGIPSTKVADIVTGISLTTADQGTWKTYKAASPITLPAGTYWIGVHQSVALSGTFIVSDDQTGFNATNFLTGLCYYSSNGSSWTDYVSSSLYMVNLIRPNFADVTIPFLSTVPGNLDFGYVASGSTAELSYILAGDNLETDPISITAPSGFGVSLTPGGPYTSSLNVTYTLPTLANTTVYVQFAPAGPDADYSGDITNVGGGASENVIVTGTSLLSYCESYGNTTFETSVTLVNFNTINNSSGKPSGYSDYTNISTEVSPDENYNLTVNVNTDGNFTVYAFAWIDWNHDGDFADTGESFDLGSAANTENGPTSLSPSSITIPTNAIIGSTLMRVSAKYNSSPTSCETGFDGEVEDYTIIITCPAATIITEPSNSYITYGDPSSFTVSASNGSSYQWEEYTTSWNPLSEGGIYSNVTTETLDISKATFSMSGYNYRCVVTGDCGSPATSNGNATLLVNPKSLSVIADPNQFKYETQSDPVFTYNASGFADGEDEGVLTGALGREAGEAVGLYAITVGSLASANYSINLTSADFEIKPAYVLNLTAFLQGSWAGGGLMSTTLNAAGQLPANQPFSIEPWSYPGLETLPSPLSADVVDWVLVELRSDESTMLERKAGLLYKDGSVQVRFSGSTSGGDYVVVWHRNHMPVMSALKVELPIDGATFNLSSGSNLYGTNPAIELGGGVYGMITGDVTKNGVLQYSGPGNDRGAIIAQIADIVGTGTTINSVVTSGYWFADVNLNNELRYIGTNDDRSVILSNLNALTGNPQTNMTYSSVIPGAISASKDQGTNDGPFDIQLIETDDVLSLEITSTEPVVNGMVDNIQFALAWYAGDLEITDMLNAFTSNFNVWPQGEAFELDGIMYQVYVSITPVYLPPVLNSGEQVSVFSIVNTSGQSISNRLWIADNNFVNKINGMYYVSVWGSDFTGSVYNIMTGINDLPEIESAKIYPNPVIDHRVNVSLNLTKAQQVSISVMDIQGKVISITLIEPNAGLSVNPLDLSELNPGVYFLRISGNSLTMVEKLILK
jgi:hypothetical protein